MKQQHSPFLSFLSELGILDFDLFAKKRRSKLRNTTRHETQLFFVEQVREWIEFVLDERNAEENRDNEDRWCVCMKDNKGKQGDQNEEDKEEDGEQGAGELMKNSK